MSALSLALILMIASHGGMTYSWKDPAHYFGAGRSLAEGRGLYYSHYETSDDRVVSEPMTHFPPLISASFAGLILLGVDPHDAPTVANAVSWVLFLAGLSFLTLRLTRSSPAVLYVLALSVICWPYLDSFLTVASEPLFLVIMVWLSGVLTGLPGRGPVGRMRLAVVVALGAFLPLTRYVGVFFLPTLFAWWAAVRWRGSSPRRLGAELSALGLMGVPFLLWLLRNWLLTSTLVGSGHGGGFDKSFLIGIEKIGTHLTWFLLPALRPGPLWREFGFAAAIPATATGLLVAWAVWSGTRSTHPLVRGRRGAPTEAAGAGRGPGRTEPVATPLPWLLGTYLIVYAFLQPFMAFTPMNRRFFTVALCLGLPWLVFLCSRAPKARFHTALSSVLIVNFGFLGLMLLRNDTLGTLITSRKPFINDTAGQPAQVAGWTLGGVPTWLLHPPGRLQDLDEHLPDLAEILRRHDEPVAVISNAPELFPDNPVARSETAVEDWLRWGVCSTERATIVAVIEWDRWSRHEPSLTHLQHSALPDDLNQRIGQKCGHLTPVRTDHALIWSLRQQPSPT